MPNTFYDDLKISPNADLNAIKRAYRTLSKKYHTDKQTTESSHENQIRINIAYKTLSDPGSRAAYDAHLAINEPVEFKQPILSQPRSRLFDPEMEVDGSLLFLKVKFILEKNNNISQELITECHELWSDYQNKYLEIEDLVHTLNDPEVVSFIKKILSEISKMLNFSLQCIDNYQDSKNTIKGNLIIKQFGMIECYLHRAKICLTEKNHFFNVIALFSNQHTYIKGLTTDERNIIATITDELGSQFHKLWTTFIFNKLNISKNAGYGTIKSCVNKFLSSHLNPSLLDRLNRSVLQMIYERGVNILENSDTYHFMIESLKIKQINCDYVWNFLLSFGIFKVQGKLTSLTLIDIFYFSQRFIREQPGYDTVNWHYDAYIPETPDHFASAMPLAHAAIQGETIQETPSSSTEDNMIIIREEPTQDEIEIGMVVKRVKYCSVNNLYMDLILIAIEKGILPVPSLEELKSIYKNIFNSDNKNYDLLNSETFSRLHRLYLKLSNQPMPIPFLTATPGELMYLHKDSALSLVIDSKYIQKITDYRTELEIEANKWYTTRAQCELKKEKASGMVVFERLIQSGLPAASAKEIIREWYPRICEGSNSRAADLFKNP